MLVGSFFLHQSSKQYFPHMQTTISICFGFMKFKKTDFINAAPSAAALSSAVCLVKSTVKRYFND